MIDTIRVFIRDCRLHLPVGIYAAEMQAAQPVVVNVELEAAAPHHYRDSSERAMDRVVDYEAIYRFLTEDIAPMAHTYLLETVAERIVDFCFRDPRVIAARVRLEKTEIFPAAAGAGVELYRMRQT